MPPLLATGVNVTELPEQTLIELAIIDIEGVTVLFTIIVTLFEIAVGVETQVALLVKTQLTASPFTKLLDE